VRWDGGIEVGSEIGLHYDPMLAKLIVWAPTRALAVERMHRALLELTIEGVETSRDFHLRLMEDSEFRAGDIEIQWLERRLPSLAAVKAPDDAMRAAVIAAALFADRDRNRGVTPSAGAKKQEPGVPATSDAWRNVARQEGLR
jgi:acetyl-CoA carboxylase biotin carboxylase subunit